MQFLSELGAAAASRRRSLRLTQAEVAAQAGLSEDSLSRFERGAGAEFGARKLLQVLGVLGLEMEFAEVGQSETLDDLRKERGAP
jgi:HTH-type transcriptional regulator/antitoxin HipB